MSDKPKNLSDIDRFWDLNSLLPKNRPVSPTPRQSNTDTTLIDIGGDEEKNVSVPIPQNTPVSIDRGVSTMRERAEASRARTLDPYLIYTPEKGLIRRVEVSRWDSRFNFYEGFRNDAKRLFSRTAAESPHVSFFSYIPQYSQLKYSQLKWYLWWRENVRNGVYMRTDFCYILLYIYEIINCPDLIAPEKGLSMLVEVWLNYRSEHRRIDSYMCEWLCDYCLINKLACPTAKLEAILGDVVSLALLKEFYISTESSIRAGAGIFAHSSLYDWRKSRYITSDTLPIFSTHINGAFQKAYAELLANDGNEFAREIRVERSAYDGALCAYDIKRTLVVEYISYTRSPKFKFVVTDIIKYSENRVRMALGIKSRLKVTDLTDELRACIDEYFDTHLPAPRKTRKSADASVPPVNEYDKLYEPVSSELSLENALKIEKQSWSTTEILTSAFEDEPTDSTNEAQIIPEERKPVPHIDPAPAYTAPTADGEDEFASLIASLDEACRSALRMLLTGDTDGVKKSADSIGSLADALADKINETAFDIIGDSIIEPEGTGYRIISDYEGDVAKWLN